MSKQVVHRNRAAEARGSRAGGGGSGALDRRVPALSWLCLGLLACQSYDPSLLEPQLAGDSGAGDPDRSPDASDSGDAAAKPGDAMDCLPLGPGAACKVGCRERCNGADDDCDGRVDEIDRRSLCRLASAVTVCAAESCVIAACEAGHVDCNGLAADGCEASLDSTEHCGVCGRACSFSNARAECVDGSCALAGCDRLFADCDKNTDNGCERPLDTLGDCGACGQVCARPNAVMSCDGGSCKFESCRPGYDDCNGDAASADGDGCETAVDRPERCGACDVRCRGATPYCSGGQCTSLSCAPGLADCDKDNMVCETNLKSLNNCGGCRVRCGPLANASPSCASGTCAANCNSGFRDCDRSLANGCETSVRTNTNCGSCGTPCSYPNATTSCANGTCQLSSCSAGFDDCNNDLERDGCEQRLNTDTHCGGCNTRCTLANATASCSSGSCQIVDCSSGFANCDGDAGNGCEVALASSNQHCGGCNNACPSSQNCVGGRCVCTSDANCGAGRRCCDGSCIDPGSDEANCGRCGSVCASGLTCCNGSCKDLNTDFGNCGSCGRGCDRNSTNRCSAGQCRCGNAGACSGLERCCDYGCGIGLFCR